MEKIQEGYSFKYFLISVPLFITGLIIFFSFPVFYIGLGVSLLFITAAILLLLHQEGTIIDKKTKQIGRYSSHLNSQSIDWFLLGNCSRGILYFELIDQKMNSRGTSTTSRLRLHKLCFVKDWQEEEFHEYTKYEIAKKVIEKLKMYHNMDVFDKYATARSTAINRRKSKERK